MESVNNKIEIEERPRAAGTCTASPTLQAAFWIELTSDAILLVEANGTIRQSNRHAASIWRSPVDQLPLLQALTRLSQNPKPPFEVIALLDGALDHVVLKLKCGAASDATTLRLQGWNRLQDPQIQAIVIRIQEDQADTDKGGAHGEDTDAVTKMAEWLHDHPAQMLTAARLRAYQLRQSVPDAHTRAELGDIEHLLERSAGAVRRAINSLSPPPSTEASMQSELRAVIQEVKDVYGMQIQMRPHGLSRDFQSRTMELAARCVHEGLLNALKHGHSKTAAVTVEADAVGLTLLITNPAADQGDRAPAAHLANGGYGLLSLKNRVAQLGGWLALRVDPTRITDTELSIFIPDPSSPAGLLGRGDREFQGDCDQKGADGAL